MGSTFSYSPKISQIKAEWDKVNETSIQKSKASGQSFDEWVKGQGETVYRGGKNEDIGKLKELSVTSDRSVGEPAASRWRL